MDLPLIQHDSDLEVPELTLSFCEWMSVLKLAKMWDLASLYLDAVRKLSSQVRLRRPIEKLLLAREYGVGAWLRDALTVLASQREPIDASDRMQMGWETYGRLMDIRDRWRREAWVNLRSTARCRSYEREVSGYSEECGMRKPEQSRHYDAWAYHECVHVEIIIPHSPTGENAGKISDFEDILPQSCHPSFAEMVAREFAGELEHMKIEVTFGELCWKFPPI